MSTKREHSQDGVDSRKRVAVGPATIGSNISSKIGNLMFAINDILKHGDGVDDSDVKNYLGVDAYEHLSELQNTLNWQAGANGMLSTYRNKFTNIISPYNVSVWKASEIPSEYPSLPLILDPTLETAVFTHHGTTAGKLGDLSYERLEWVGDSYLELTCTLLISKTFPALLPGKCSQLRERCVKNLTLAAFARHYGFDKRAQLPTGLQISDNLSKDQDMTKIMGDMFEAYIAAIVLSDPENGIARIIDFLTKLWGITLRKEIIEAEEKGPKFDSPMWNLRGAVDHVNIRSSEVELSPKEQLQKLLGSKGIKLTYKDVAPVKKDKENKLPLFTVGVFLDGYGKKELQLGHGQGNGKKDAGVKAAEMALGRKKLMKELTEKKLVHDAQLEREREALDGVA